MMVSFIIIISFIFLKHFSILMIYEVYRHADMPVVFMVNMIDDGDGDDANEWWTCQIIRSEDTWSYSALML